MSIKAFQIFADTPKDRYLFGDLHLQWQDAQHCKQAYQKNYAGQDWHPGFDISTVQIDHLSNQRVRIGGQTVRRTVWQLTEVEQVIVGQVRYRGNRYVVIYDAIVHQWKRIIAWGLLLWTRTTGVLWGPMNRPSYRGHRSASEIQ